MSTSKEQNFSDRRLVAIMFSDIVGFTKIMGGNEEKALDMLDKNRTHQKTYIEKHNGRMLKEMGDGVLAQFDSVLDSLLCAMKIQKLAQDELADMIRIGIHLGDVTTNNEDIFGDGVNIASRLQSIADPGGIYISEAIQNSIRNRKELRTRLIGEVNLKNVDRPMKTYFVEGKGLPTPSKSRIKELTGAPGVESLAVLPFTNMSADPDNAFFADGMHDALIGELSHIKELRVISRTSTLQYRNVEKPIPVIAKELNVETLLEASVMIVDDNVRIQAQLIQASPEEKHLWAQSYDREIKDIFGLQKEIVEAISNEINVNLSEAEKLRLEQSRAINPEAYKALLKGKSHFDQLAPASIEKALNYYQLALEHDPNFADAYAAIAEAWAALKQIGAVSPDEGTQNIESAALKAIELDDTVAEAHYALAMLNTWTKWDLNRAENEFSNALRLDPNNAECLAFYSHFLMIRNRPEEALRAIDRAVKLDPFNSFLQGLKAAVLLLTGKNQDAIDLCLKVQESTPSDILTDALLNYAYHEIGKYEESIQHRQAFFAKIGDDEAAEILAKTFEEGYFEALTKTAELLASREQCFVPEVIFQLYAHTGNKELALDWAEKTYEMGDPNTIYFGVIPYAKFLLDEPRFQTLLAKMGL